MNSEMLNMIERISFEVQSTALSFFTEGCRLFVTVLEDDIFSQADILCDLVEALKDLGISFGYVSENGKTLKHTFSLFMD